MSTWRTAGTVVGLSLALVACAGGPRDHVAHPAGGPGPMVHADMARGEPQGGMAPMDESMKRMHEMHDRMMQAKTPEERNALMAEHMKTMRDGMAMMGNMGGPGGMGGMGHGMGHEMGHEMGRDKGAADCSADAMASHQRMMGKRMDMMQSMMEMMMDRLPAQAPPTK
jgi:hypothetical protein